MISCSLLLQDDVLENLGLLREIEISTYYLMRSDNQKLLIGIIITFIVSTGGAACPGCALVP